MRWLSQTADEGLGTTFDQHVIAGYRFIMRYYREGDKIYLFGFSRGAFTARFLARMISTIGLLSMGNEEMVPFAYKSYQDYEIQSSDLSEKGRAAEMKNKAYMDSFKTTFCRAKAEVHFLGLFDTVNSVGIFDPPLTTATYLPPARKTAIHIRHAVSIDERRAKFKAALLQQEEPSKEEDVVEVFFPGNHGDVGGGWSPGDLLEKNLPKRKSKPYSITKASDIDVDESIKLTDADKSEADDPVQLSDIALEWMVSELENLPEEEQIAWNYHKNIFKKNFYNKIKDAITAPQHDLLKYGGGGSRVMTFLWHFLGEQSSSSLAFSHSLEHMG